jgi:acyl-homoserine lactone acylase PvdQ
VDRVRIAPLLAVLAAACLVGVSASEAKRAKADYAAVALNILPPGQSGSLSFPPTATDQAKLYDGLTPLFDQVTNANFRSYFKQEGFGLAPGEKAKRTERPKANVTIVRDRWDVPHVYGKTRADVEFGAGYATAEDRLLLMQLLRGPGRIAALDIPGIDPFQVAFAAQEFVPTAAAEAVLTQQAALVGRTAKGRLLLRDVDSYLAGINRYIKDNGDYTPHWTRNDVIAIAALIGARFGVGGGDEARRSQFLSALQARLGAAKGRSVWNDLRSENDPEAPVSVDGTYTARAQPGDESGNVVLDAGSVKAAATIKHTTASNALLVAASRSKTGHPLFVAGPQVGYAFPELLLELDLHGGGFDARGSAFPGISFYILIGRGKDFAWSATSSGSDIVDQFVETLCNGDDAHYMFKGQCRAMDTLDAGVLKGKNGVADRELTFRSTVHGPVVGYATVKGTKVAISSDRSTRGSELTAAYSFMDLNRNTVHDAKSFLKTMSTFPLTFNWFYADNKNIAMFSSGKVPLRAANVNLGLPTKGTGDYEWRGTVAAKDHPQGIDRKGGVIANWNNKPGRGWPSADDTWDYQSTYRVDLLTRALPAGKVTLPQVVNAMNKAATQDIRAVVVWPTISHILPASVPPGGRPGFAAMIGQLDTWSARGGSRLDRDLDGKIDEPGAAIMDVLWPKLADAVLSPVLGSLTDELATLVSRNNQANSGGSAYAAGWYGYVSKDIRSVFGQPVTGPYSTRYCGDGDRDACIASLRAALIQTYDELAAAQGADPSAWRADATKERITFGLLPATMRWANRPTFQQVISFSSHRP